MIAGLHESWQSNKCANSVGTNTADVRKREDVTGNGLIFGALSRTTTDTVGAPRGVGGMLPTPMQRETLSVKIADDGKSTAKIAVIRGTATDTTARADEQRASAMKPSREFLQKKVVGSIATMTIIRRHDGLPALTDMVNLIPTTGITVDEQGASTSDRVTVCDGKYTLPSSEMYNCVHTYNRMTFTWS